MTTPQLTREAINLMIQSQRMIKKEFGVRIQLDDKQAIYRFLAYANKSSSKELKTCTEKLLEQLVADNEITIEEAPADKTTAKVRYYRGVPVPVTEAQQASQAAGTEQKKTRYIIYRGQKVAY